MTGLGTMRRESREKWQAGLSDELRFWEEFMTAETWKWHRDARFSPDYHFPDFGMKLLGPSSAKALRVLDVGSGPASTIGRKWAGHTIDLTTVDPLADEFNALLTRCGYREAATIVRGSAETLLDTFDHGSFDFVYCGNALDHTHAPLLAIRNMIEVVKPGGWLVLLCYENEGETESYTGLHQWNFCLRDRRLVLWNHEGSVDVFEALEGCERHRTQALPPNPGDKRKRLMASVRKQREGDATRPKRDAARAF